MGQTDSTLISGKQFQQSLEKRQMTVGAPKEPALMRILEVSFKKL